MNIFGKVFRTYKNEGLRAVSRKVYQQLTSTGQNIQVGVSVPSKIDMS